MTEIKRAIISNVCSFYEVVHEELSLNEREFAYRVDTMLVEILNLEEYIQQSDIGTIYDIEEINEISKNIKLKKKYTDEEIIKIGTKAFAQTIEKDKTINVEAFVDNLVKELKR